MIYIISNNQLIDYKNIKVSSLVDCFAYFLNIKYVQVDTETIGDCWSGHIYTLQLGDSSNQFVIDYQSLTGLEKIQIKAFLEDKDKIFILQNAKYDLKFFYKESIKLKNIYDTFLAECILTTGRKERGLGLNALGRKYLGIEISKEVRGKINYLGLTEEVVIYAATDVMHLENIMLLQLKEIERLELEKLLDLENSVVKVFAEMEFNGFKLNQDKWLKLHNKSEEEVTKYLAELNQIIYDNKEIYKDFIEHKVDLFSDEYKVNINWNSPKQITALLNLSGLKIESVNEKLIEKFRKQYTIIDKYLNYKEHQTKISKFGKNFLKWVNPFTGNVHTSFWQILNTGRISSGRKDESPNMQNLPAEKEYRASFESEEGWDIVGFDFGSQELILLASDSNEPVFVNATNNNWDLHSYVADMTFPEKWKNDALEDCEYFISKQKCKCPEHKKLRDKIKTLNYSLSYGAGASKLAQSLNISVNEAKLIIYNYFLGMPILKNYFEQIKQFARNNLMMRSFYPYRRIRFFDKPDNQEELASIEREGLNDRIQATGADITKLALVKLWNYREEHNIPVKFLLQVHDEILTTTPEHFSKEWYEIKKKLMLEAANEICTNLQIPVDGYIAKTWQK